MVTFDLLVIISSDSDESVASLMERHEEQSERTDDSDYFEELL